MDYLTHPQIIIKVGHCSLQTRNPRCQDPNTMVPVVPVVPLSFPSHTNLCSAEWMLSDSLFLYSHLSLNQGRIDCYKVTKISCTLRQSESEVTQLLFATPWTVAYQDPPSMGFSRQEYWSGVPLYSPEDLPNPGIEPGSPAL